MDGETLNIWSARFCGNRIELLALLCDVEAFGTIGIVVSTAEEFTQYRIVPGKNHLGTRSVRIRVTDGFFTPLGLMCQPAR